MSLIRQMWLVVVATALIAFAGSFTVNVASARHYLEAQLRVKNSDNAAALALSLSQQKGDLELMELLLAAQFDTGFYERIRFQGSNGKVIERVARAVDPQAPRWFVAWVPIESAPGVAQVSDGWRALGSVQVVSHVSYAYRDLWRGCLQAGAWLALVGLVAGVVGNFIVQGIRRPLNSTVTQAQALVNGQFVTVAEPRVPELQRLTRAMNGMVHRLKTAFDEQAGQVEALRRQANCDPATGVSHRRHFMTRLESELEREDAAPRGVLVMVRIVELARVNAELGRRETDRLIQQVAQVLQDGAHRCPGAWVGRLNGSDFALCLPAPEAAGAEGGVTAEALANELAQACRPFGEAQGVVLGAVDYRSGTPMSQLLSAADEALARAEAQGLFACVVQGGPDATHAAEGEEGWKRRIEAALQQGRVQLARYPLVDRQGALVHSESPLRLQLEPGGPYESAARWLPLAVRTQTVAAVDLAVVALALADIGRGAGPLGVNLSVASVLDPGFAAALRERLEKAPQAAQLWLEVPESAAVRHHGLVRELCQQVRHTGARFGIEHAGEQLSRIERLYEIGLDYIKLDARFVRGAADDQAVRNFVQGTAAMAHGLGIQLYAEGVTRADDAEALWACGVDGITGPWAGSAVRQG
ncbi:bifunctional diguanylate cyclase/phosphodiesterase [Eleftheria terrae]|uniref:bifunctional diguanylate cyclase/phosphodiesterase n=1 Tax=Eleftheria terrae TaxID=1597781 RepID=UPI00263A8858|nr:EAL domain-containing protein [Eleftheria terrae]WKB53544.1 EAL domain-containing protein [Eleftheria terrae]